MSATINKVDIVSAEPNPKVHRPVFHGTKKGKTWVAKRVSSARHLVLNPAKHIKSMLPPTKDLEHMPPLNAYTVASGIFGLFATGGIGTASMFLTDFVAGKVKANMTNPAYGPVRDIVRLAFEGVFGLSVIPYIASKATKDKAIGQAFWVGDTILVGVDLGVTVFKYVAMGIMAAKNKAVPPTPAQPAAASAGMAMLGLSGLEGLMKGVHTATPTENLSTTPSVYGVDGTEGVDGAVLAELQKEKTRFQELSSLMQGSKHHVHTSGLMK